MRVSLYALCIHSPVYLRRVETARDARPLQTVRSILSSKESLEQRFFLWRPVHILLDITVPVFDSGFRNRERRNMCRWYIFSTAVKFARFAPCRLAVFAQQPIDKHYLGVRMRGLRETHNAARACGNQSSVFFEIRHDAEFQSSFLEIRNHILTGAEMNGVSALGNPLDHATLVTIDGTGLGTYAFVIRRRLFGT